MILFYELIKIDLVIWRSNVEIQSFEIFSKSPAIKAATINLHKTIHYAQEYNMRV